MMDRISIAVLEKICSLAATGRFVVFSEDELYDAFPESEVKSESVLKGVLKNLKEDGYIDLKYSSGNLHCIAPLKNYTPLPEPEIIEPEIEEKVPKTQHIRGAIFFSAFLGGALGSLIISIIFAFIQMLTRCENEVMSAVYSLCDGTDGCLVSPIDILSVLPAKHKINTEKLDDILNALKCDGYFDLIPSERKGEKMYVINLKESGFAYKRTAKQKQRDITFKIFLAFIGAFATFIFGLLLKAIF